MNLLHTAASFEVALLGWLLLLPAALLALRSVRGGFLAEGGQQHAWLAGVVCLALLWNLQVEAGNGPHFGMLGSALYALLFGPARAILGLLAALALFTQLDEGAWINFGINGALLALLPALLVAALQRLIARRLPHNLFIFIIGNGMFVTLAATAVTSVALLALSLAAMAPAAAAHAGAHWADYAGYSLLLAWGEALLSGMLFSALVIFCPRLVLTYDEDTYLPPRDRR
jgi:uncharacterized membrane protein